MWLPWQRLVVAKLYHLYAHLGMSFIHPYKFEEISKIMFIRTSIYYMFLVKCGYMITCRTQVISPLYICTSISSIHASLKKFHKTMNEELSAQEFVNFLVKCGYHGNALAYPSYITFTHIYTSISSIHASLKKFHQTTNEELSAQELANGRTDAIP